jgi:glucokinase
MHDDSDNGVAAARLAIGIDVGGTKIAAGLVDLSDGAILMRETLPTLPQRGGEAVLSDVVALAERMLAVANAREQALRGIGLGVAELVAVDGAITSAHTIPWIGVPVRQRLSQIAPTIVESDVRTLALAEARYGAGRDIAQFVMVSVGTGISSCLVLDGKPHAGIHGNALVLATSPVTTTCTECGAVLRPVLEEFASGPAVIARYQQRSGRQVARGEAIFQAADAGDADAIFVLSTAGEALGVSIGWLVNVLDPAAVIVGGGLGLAGGCYWEHMVGAMREHIWAENSRAVPCLPAATHTDAGIIGAAAYLNIR